MKRLIFFFLLSPVLFPAQNSSFFPDSLPSGATRVALPETKHNYRHGGNEFIVTNDADYKALFADSIHAKLPGIDFKRHELLAKSYCMQCLITCRFHPQCHRNACMYTRSWYLLEKKQRIMLTAVALKEGNCSFLPGFVNQVICRDDSSFSDLQRSCPALKNDTVDFNKRIVVAREMYLDCSARIEQEFYLDTVQHCMVWRLYTGYGGCHGMSAHRFVFSLPKPPEGYVIRFEQYGFLSED